MKKNWKLSGSQLGKDFSTGLNPPESAQPISIPARICVLCSYSASDVIQLNNPAWSWWKPSDPCLNHVSKQAEETIKYFEEQMIPCCEKKKLCLWSFCTSQCLFTHSLAFLWMRNRFPKKQNTRELTWTEGKISRFLPFLFQNWPPKMGPWIFMKGWWRKSRGFNKVWGSNHPIRLKMQPSWELPWIFQT